MEGVLKRPRRLYVAVLIFSALLAATSGIVGDIAAARLPAWIGPFLPWVWPGFGALFVASVALVVIQARLEKRENEASLSQSIHVHVGAPPSKSPALSSQDTPTDKHPVIYHNLPQPDYGTFVGRDKELEQVHRILRPYPRSREHLVTIDGVGGIGKSALALEVAHRYLRDYARLPQDERFEALIWASAKASVLTADGIASRRQVTRTLDDIYTTVAITLDREDITRAPSEDRDGLVTKALTQQRSLLIVDNLETVDDERVNTFLRELPVPTKAIVTTRHRIDVAYPVRLVGMSRQEAQQLIVSECKKKDVTLTREQARKLYDRTGGVPLALVWSVAQVGYGYDIESVLTRLGNPRGDIARFCFEDAIERIKGTGAYALLLALAVFSTDTGRDALGYVAGFSEDVLSRDEGLVTLERLSLANKRDGRFGLLPLTKAYATSLSPGAQAFRQRQVRFYLDFCREHVGGTTENWRIYEKVDPERENLIDAMEWCQQSQRWQGLIDLQDSLWSYWELRSYWSEQERWCQRALEACGKLSSDAHLSTETQRKKGTFHLALCWVRINQDRFGEATVEASRASEIFEPIEYWHGVAVAHRHLGLVEKLVGESRRDGGDLDHAERHFDRARKHYEVSLKIWQRLGNQREISSVLANIGHQLIAQGEYLEARRFLARALELLQQVGDESRMSTNLRALGEIDEWEGDFASAADYYSRALEIAHQVDDKVSGARAASKLAELSLKQSDYTEAVRHSIRANELFQSINLTACTQRDAERNKVVLRQARASLEEGTGTLELLHNSRN